MIAGRALSQDRRVADGGTPAALIVIRALPCTEPMAPTEVVLIGVDTHLAAGDTFADCLSRSAFRDNDLHELALINRKAAAGRGPRRPPHPTT
jgi:hypothetical protein